MIPSWMVFASMISKSYEYVFAQHATLSECAVCRNFVLKLSLSSHVNSFSLRTS